MRVGGFGHDHQGGDAFLLQMLFYLRRQPGTLVFDEHQGLALQHDLQT